jgi:hypothetical protein
VNYTFTESWNRYVEYATKGALAVKADALAYEHRLNDACFNHHKKELNHQSSSLKIASSKQLQKKLFSSCYNIDRHWYKRATAARIFGSILLTKILQ